MARNLVERRLIEVSGRLKNLQDERMRAVLETAAERFGWGRTKPAAGHGVGLACGTEKGGYVASCAEVVVDRSSSKAQIVRVVTAYRFGPRRYGDGPDVAYGPPARMPPGGPAPARTN